MTNEEAIKILEECLGQGRFFDSSLKQAYDMAINALKTLDNNTSVLDEKASEILMDIIEKETENDC